MRVVPALHHQAEACRALGSPMYGELLGRLADDAGSGGATWDLLAAHDSAPGPSALALRLLGSLHRLVLSGRAESLVPFYPSAGGSWQAEAGSAAVLRFLRERPAAVAEWLDRPPQTNEVGRCAALAGALLHLPGLFGPPGLPVRLRELGASAGLNLNPERYAYGDATGRVAGEAASPVRLVDAWHGSPVPWRPLPVVLDREGCDPHPVDPRSPEGRLTLTAYTWADQEQRLARLRTALEVAAAVPAAHQAAVRKQDAVSFVRELTLAEGTTTVVWHSVMWQYLPPEDQAEIDRLLERLGSTATPTRGLARIFLEPTRRTPGADHEFLVVLRTWPGGGPRILGRAEPHGLPVTWEAGPVTDRNAPSSTA